MNHQLINFINTYLVSLSRSEPEALLGWFELFFPWWHCLSMFQRYTGSRLLPASKVHRSFVTSEIRFQMKRLIDESVASLDRINDSFLAIQQGPNSTSSSAFLGSAVTAVKLHQHRLKETLRLTGGLHTSSWFGPFLTSTGTKYRKLCEDYERSKRMRTRLEEIQYVITTSKLDQEILQDDLQFLRTTFMRIADVDLAAEGVIKLARAFREHLRQQDWGVEPNKKVPAANGSVRFQLDQDRANQKDLSNIQSALILVCNDRTAGGAIHMICAIQRYASAFSKFDDGLIYGTQRNWLVERAQAQRRYEQEIRATYEHIAEVVIHASKLLERGRQIPEYLG